MSGGDGYGRKLRRMKREIEEMLESDLDYCDLSRWAQASHGARSIRKLVDEYDLPVEIAVFIGNKVYAVRKGP